LFEAIDHVVLNVEAGDLQEAVSWYEQVLGFQPRQSFTIQTDRSALQSQVLVCDQVQLPINAPCSSNSQIQEFLTHNRGPGIQHVALRTQDVIHTVAYLRERGIPFLTVPETYYQALQERHHAKTLELDWQALATQQILIDWPLDLPQSLLLQTFTQPIFAQPTFFFEVIERRTYHHQGQMHQAQGFGEGNFQALFEAIEREQEKRGSLKPRVNPAIKICNKTEMGLIDR
jgi:4-hydroxyphenylpyruvate dioxygenase